MNKIIKFIIPLLAVMFCVSSASAQLFPRNTRDDDRYSDRRYEDRRYEDDRYNNRYGNNWYDIARTRVTGRDNYERVNLNSRDSRNLRQLLFKTDGPVNIYRVAVRYRSGRTEELRIRNNGWDNRKRYSKNNELMVAVPSSRRNDEIRQVMFWYDADSRLPFSRPTVSIFGR